MKFDDVAPRIDVFVQEHGMVAIDAIYHRAGNGTMSLCDIFNQDLTDSCNICPALIVCDMYHYGIQEKMKEYTKEKFKITNPEYFL